jgi:hypothetical protein
MFGFLFLESPVCLMVTKVFRNRFTSSMTYTMYLTTLNDFLASWVLFVFSFLFVHWTHLFYLFFYVASKYYYVLFLRFYNLVCMYIFTLFHLSFWTCVYNFLFLCLSLFIRFSPPSLHTFVLDEKVIQTFLRSVYHRITVTICEKKYNFILKNQ